MIELENVSMTYPGGIEALKNVNINIEKGEFVFIVGSSGSGKTTLSLSSLKFWNTTPILLLTFGISLFFILL